AGAVGAVLERRGHRERVRVVAVVDENPFPGERDLFAPPARGLHLTRATLGLSEWEPEGVVRREGREGVGRVVSPRETELDRQRPAEGLHLQAGVAVLRSEVGEADVAALAEADDLDVVALQVGIEVAFAGGNDRGPARR